MGLYHRAGVDIPPRVHMTIRSVIDDEYDGLYSVLRLAGVRAPQPEAMDPLAGPVIYNDKMECIYN